ncbi:hypothetical protein [Asticcacaulis endophyticus]|jgi:hypothetical protein|uniref:Uncharacterized protein n=1 Tax=Asticcacaulis endophyticus TaxID=1395890 RepID=A0A918Q770_9CAUL|nr:hypothetical protein [Asticcacaulis endophyticus]GGZ34661.1 hypothetical protein GCM10011273_21380 [Asticcacaulis endophyticus]
MSLIMRVKIAALIVFVFATGGVWVYTALYEMPRKKCEAAGAWWSNQYRICRAPVYLPTITGRAAGEGREIHWPTEQAPTTANTAPGAKAPEVKAPDVKADAPAS